MKKLIILLFFLPAILSAQTFSGRNIKVKMTTLKNSKIYLGTYYEKKRIVADSALIDMNGNGVFYNNQKFIRGVYFLVTPSFNALQDFIIGPEQEFTIVSDTLYNKYYTITGSLNNDLFKSYNDFVTSKTKDLQELERSYPEAGMFKDSVQRRKNIIIQYNTIQNEIKNFKEKLIKDNPDTYITKLFNAMKRPETPAIPIVNGRADSSYPYRYVKSHFWDEIDFNDDGLMRTPFFEDKLDEYFDKLVPKDPDSIIKEVRYIMAYARSNKEMYSYFLNKFTNKYWFPKYLGEDKVFIFLYENYFSQGDTTYVTHESRKNVRERYYKLVGNFVGTQAAPMNLKDTGGLPISLYNIPSPLTFVVFWDPTCGHCKTQVPKIDSFYKASWKSKRVVIFAMNMNRNKDLKIWKDFIIQHNIKGWYHGYEPEEDERAEALQGRNIRQSYNIFETPIFYLLDKNKRIIGKGLNLEQYDDLINEMFKKNNSTDK